MLDNEPNDTERATESATTGPETGSAKPARKRAAAKRTTKKTAAKAGPGAETAVVAQTTAPEIAPVETDGLPGQPGDVLPAKKAAAKKTAAKRTTAKRTAKKTAEAPEAPSADAAAADGAAGPGEAFVGEAPAKKTARKRTTKKAAADQPTAPAVVDDARTAPTATDATATPSASTDLGSTSPGSTDAVAPAPTSADAAASTADGAGSGRSSRSRSRSRSRAAATTGQDAEAAVEAARATVAQEGAEAARAMVGQGGAAEAATQITDTPAESSPDEKPSGGRRRRRPAATAEVLFQAPAPVEPERPSRRRTRKTAEEPVAETTDTTDATAVEGAAPAGTAEVEEKQPRARRSRRRTKDADQVEDEIATTTASAETSADTTAESGDATGEQSEADDEQGDGEGDGPRRRRRRRGGRRRRKSSDSAEADDNDEDSTDDDGTDTTDATDSADATDDAESADGSEDGDQDGEGGGSRRRRRRRRRKGEEGASSTDDPDEVVVRVREPRKTSASEITAVEGSTRLEAKKQRRREGRAAGRRRAPIVTEAEFLARRESVERTMVIRARENLTQIAVSEDNVLVEHYVAQEDQTSLIGNVYVGRVQNVLPSMEAAFIDIGKGRNAVLYAGEVDWATLGGASGPRKIEQVLKSGQSVLVQVTKDPIGHKGARLTNQISLPGRYVVYVPRGGNGGISRKLPDIERNRLKGILKEIVPDEAGVIVRTAAEGASEDELTRDVSRLKSYWDDIEKKAAGGQAPQLVYGEPDLLIRVVRDLFTEDFGKLVIQGDDAFDLVNDYVSYVAPHLADRVEKWQSTDDVFGNFRIDEQIKKALDRKVWLPSGGSLVIDRTEAMTVVDVNTGKFTGSGGNLEETVTRNNLEAAEEIVRQLRLRDIGGIIVIDFIDMVLESNRDLVLRRLVECLGRDRTKHQVAEVTSLGLVQMTRKRIGTGLLEAFSETCDHCGGRGLILHDEPREPKRRTEESNGNGRGRDSKSGGKSSSRGGRGRGKKNAESNGTADKKAEEPVATPV